MKMKVLILNITVVLFTINIFSAHAQNILVKSDIEKYLSTLTPLKNLAKINVGNPEDETEIKDQTEDIPPPLFDPSNISRTPVTDTLEYTKNHPTFAEFSMIIDKAGFSSPDQWADIGDKIMMAYSAYNLKNPPSSEAADLNEVKRDLAKKLEAVRKNQFISKQQKETLIKKLQNSIELINDPNYIDSENISMISLYIEQLNSHFKEEQ